MKQHPIHEPGSIPLRQLSALDAVARRLARAYPPDWLERRWRSLYAATLAACFAAAVALSLAWHPWWSFLLPLLAPSLLLVVLPQLLWRRTPGRPRWAHPLAVLERQDAELVRRIAGLPDAAPLGGDRFYAIWHDARCAAGFHLHLH